MRLAWPLLWWPGAVVLDHGFTCCTPGCTRILRQRDYRVCCVVERAAAHPHTTTTQPIAASRRFGPTPATHLPASSRLVGSIPTAAVERSALSTCSVASSLERRYATPRGQHEPPQTNSDCPKVLTGSHAPCASVSQFAMPSPCAPPRIAPLPVSSCPVPYPRAGSSGLTAAG